MPSRPKIAEDAGACAVMALERVPSDIRKEGGVARMAAPKIIREIMDKVSDSGDGQGAHRPFRRSASAGSARSGLHRRERSAHAGGRRASRVEARLQVPFVCGARNLGEALRRIAEGAAMVRTKGEAGSGNIVEAVRHMRTIVSQMKRLTTLGPGGAGPRIEGTRRAAGSGELGGEARQAARAEFLGGWRGDSGGCGAGDAAGRGSRVRRARAFLSRAIRRNARARS